MTKSIDKSNCVSKIGTSKSEDAMHQRTRVTRRTSYNIIQPLHYLESKISDLEVCSVNIMTIRGRSGENVEMLEHK